MGTRLDRVRRLAAVGFAGMAPNEDFSEWVAFREARRRLERGVISRTAWAVYVALLDREKRTHDRVIAAYAWICAKVHAAKGTAIKAIKELEAAGMLLVVPQRAQTGWASRVTANGYVLLQPPPLPKRPRRLPEIGSVLPGLLRRVRAVVTESKPRPASESVPNQTLALAAPPRPSGLEAALARLGAAMAAKQGAQGVAE